MGILSAMNKSVGGLNAQSFALENISGNIANSQTTAFKRTDTSFYDLVASGASRVSLMSAGNVRAASRSTVNIQGSIE
ncbi:MAG TPA: flagellar basal body protein, partial [Methylomirabilota bacterium]|nr:flagellar basal body protein [Methylomirabilota bacterium]